MLKSLAPCLALLSACATVAPGHADVVTSPSGVEPAPLGEGVHYIGPWSDLTDFDLRAASSTVNFETVGADGSTLRASASLVTFRPDPEHLVDLVREEPADYAKVLVVPYVESGVRRALGRLTAFELDSGRLTQAQAEVMAFAAPRLLAHHVILEGVELRGVRVLSTPTYQSVLATEAAAQAARAAPTLLELARQQADARRQRAQGLADAHRAIAPTLTGAVLVERQNRAWQNLLTSPSSQVVRAGRAPISLEVSP